MLWLILAIVVIALVVLFYIFPIIQVCGDSMYPTYKDGDIVLGCRIFSIKRGGIYVYHPPAGEKYVIKRLTRIINFPNLLFFEGDNSEHSYDSRMYGCISNQDLVAKCIFTIHRRKECNDNGCK